LFQNRSDAVEHAGGDTTQMLKTRTYLQKLGVEVDISLEPEPDLRHYDLVHIFNMSTARYGVRQVRNAKAQGVPVALSTIYWDRRHKYLDPDVVRFNEIALIRLLGRSCGRLGPPLLNVIKSLIEIPGQRLELEMLRGADLLLPNSYAEAEVIAVLFDAPWVRSKTVVVNNGIEVPRNPEGAEGPLQDEQVPDLPGEYVLEVGRIEPVKGQLKVIKALYDRPEIPLVFIGRAMNPAYFEACKKLGRERGNTWFIRQVPHEDLGSYYRRAKVHVLPSLRESPGLVTLEAALYNANCVVSVHGPIIEYFGQDAWCCDPASIDSVHQAILAAWTSPRSDLLKSRILESYTWENAAATTLSAYQTLLRGSQEEAKR
jgi:glycosyltransferase involved in cell wall biosynthesis